MIILLMLGYAERSNVPGEQPNAMNKAHRGIKLSEKLNRAKNSKNEGQIHHQERSLWFKAGGGVLAPLSMKLVR
jgi:hypothetical protein